MSMGEKLWESSPRIESLSEEENVQVYRGNFETVVNRVKAISDTPERDRAIQNISGSIGSRLRELSGVKDIAETEWRDAEKVNEYQHSMDNLDKLNQELLSLHQG